MKYHFAGDTHLTLFQIAGAARRNIEVTDRPEEADVIFLAEDVHTFPDGRRSLTPILIELDKLRECGKPIVLMSQVPPGFCRERAMPNLYHYPETLRIKDAWERAWRPDYIILGCPDGKEIPAEINVYAYAFSCTVLRMSYEEAEFSKIAVNTHLAMQVEYANRMDAAARKIGADWGVIKQALHLDRRIGPHAYLEPGRWQDSLHLLRDSVTLKEIEES